MWNIVNLPPKIPGIGELDYCQIKTQNSENKKTIEFWNVVI